MCPILGPAVGSEPERGDVVVFRHPVNGSDFIKRLIGPAGRHGADEGWRAVPERSGSAADPRWHLCREPMNVRARWASSALRERPVGEGATCTEVALHRNAAGGAHPCHPEHRHERLRRQHRCLYRARGALLLHGRQPRQQPGQPLWQAVGGVGFVPFRSSDRAGRPDHVLVRRAVDAVFLDMAQRPLLQGGGVRAFGRSPGLSGPIGHSFRAARASGACGDACLVSPRPRGPQPAAGVPGRPGAGPCDGRGAVERPIPARPRASLRRASTRWCARKPARGRARSGWARC
jgi:hypothetical protein